MIEACDFVEAARVRGFQWYAGVPCSYLTPFINYVLQDSTLRYLSMANEGDAVALMAGIALSGAPDRPHRGIAMMQNSGLGNAVSPLTSLTWTFRLPQLLIVTWRGQPGVPDEPQHELMGAITPGLLDSLQIPWELFPTAPAAVGAVLDRAVSHMDETGRPFALLMQKGSVAAHSFGADASVVVESPLVPAGVVRSRRAVEHIRPSRRELLREVVKRTPSDSTAILASTGFCGRELYAIDDRSNHFYMVGSMGCIASLALGLALARPDLRVIALDGDGAALMRLGSMTTVGVYGPPNLQHVIIDNGVHDSTGGQATVSPRISFAHIAAACGYASAVEIGGLDHMAEWLDAPPLSGPRLAWCPVRTGTGDLPRPSIGPAKVAVRLMQHFCARTGV